MSATELFFIEVAQPMNNGNTIQVRRITVGEYLGSPWPGLEIRHTCDSNRVEIPGVGARNSNVAYDLRFRVDCKVPNADRGAPSDTAFVTLDVTEGETLRRREPSDIRPETFDAAVQATVDAIRVNATFSQPPIRTLRLRIRGPRRYAVMSRDYRVVNQKAGRQYY